MKSQLIALFLIGALFSLTACNPPTTEQTPPPEQEETPTEEPEDSEMPQEESNGESSEG
ncbi:MAG: hypothetical protein RI580_01740 [Halothece sp. Uz-M2-17]|nr:hypothetical protein [Halothece sp. Uz-M2-17]